MNRIPTYRLLRRNVKLSEKRHPALTQKLVAKVMLYIGAAIFAIYWIILGSMFGRLAVEDDAPGVILVMMAFLLLLDFFLRFLAQQTPMVFIKPYLLLPVRTQWVVEAYLLSMILSGYNCLWLSLLLPFAYVSLVGGLSFAAVSGLVVLCMLLFLANSQWYLLVRTLIQRSLLWWLLPIAVYGVAVLALLLLPSDIVAFVDDAIDFMSIPAVAWASCLLVALALLGLLLFNRNMHCRFIYAELSREQKKPTAIKHVSQFAFLDGLGIVGEYLKLELKSIMRCKAIRSRVIMSLSLIVVFSLIIAYTPIYDNPLFINFWCYYCFSIYGISVLMKVMCTEGNYIDLLMTQHENILQLLRAKYYIHVAVLFVPLLIMLPAVIQGKFTILMMLAYMLTTSGIAFPMMFQLAVFNKQTLPLHSQLAGKNSIESGLQLLIELGAMFLPLALAGLLIAFTGEDTAYYVLIVIGLAMTAAHPLWLRNVYRRMMMRKYQNMEGFHASR